VQNKGKEIAMNTPYNKVRSFCHSENGFSLTEMIIVILIIAVISTIALMNIGSSKKQLGRQNVARELKSAFERARFDSVKRRATTSPDNRANVVISANSFTLNTDADQDGTIESGEESVNNAWMSDVSIKAITFSPTTVTAITSPVTIYFDKRGEVTTSSGSAVFLVCNGDCSTPSVSNSNLILVTQTGTVNILSGGQTVPTFSTPVVNTISNSANINPDVTIN
jgi:prepilin-type N-terminal cleavage/methylation domain-containing protein